MPSAATISAVIASWVSVPQVSRSPKRLSHSTSNSPITANRCPAARFSARAACRSRRIVDPNIHSIMTEGSDKTTTPISQHLRACSYSLIEIACRGHCRTASSTCSSFSGVTSSCNTVNVSSSSSRKTSGTTPMHTPLLSHRPQSTSIFFVTQTTSSQHLHRDVQPAGDILHADPLAVIPLHFVVGHEVEQLLQRDPALHPCQCGAEATVNPVSQAHVLRLGLVAVDVEGVGVGKGVRIAVRGGVHHEHRLARWNRAATDVGLFEGVADVVLHRSLVAQQFLDGSRDLTAVCFQLLPLVGVAGEQHRRAADQLG